MEYGHIIQQVAISIIPIMLAVILHEVSHGYVAYKLGDPTAKAMGRLTLNPISHIDILGTIVMPLVLYVMTNGSFVFGYAKPVPINANNFKNPKRDMAISAAAGPITNILIAILSMLLLKHILAPLAGVVEESTVNAILNPLALMLRACIIINVVLAVFNMIPIPPLDGGRVLTGMLPYRHAITLSKIEPYGLVIVILLAVTHIADIVIFPIIKLILGILYML
jgi:Zn-dependent protease